ncbi:hypothetical protein LTR37_001871 [Vermiconidia calcicola]|uniref:Uncharacterized protein n=1 Tax=Vermiconidia calcicola TaxID=1690605 RepID=A0ACC3NVD6_9PEZI|nr:hypothetical protein LTR37_001871 [Vermiconidia calcicola]
METSSATTTFHIRFGFDHSTYPISNPKYNTKDPRRRHVRGAPPEALLAEVASYRIFRDVCLQRLDEHYPTGVSADRRRRLLGSAAVKAFCLKQNTTAVVDGPASFSVNGKKRSLELPTIEDFDVDNCLNDEGTRLKHRRVDSAVDLTMLTICSPCPDSSSGEEDYVTVWEDKTVTELKSNKRLYLSDETKTILLKHAAEYGWVVAHYPSVDHANMLARVSQCLWAFAAELLFDFDSFDNPVLAEASPPRLLYSAELLRYTFPFDFS